MLSENTTNLAEMLHERVRLSPDAVAYRQFNGQQWVDMTWREFAREIGRWQAALEQEGVEPGDRVAICARNRVEWALFDQAALGLGLVTVPLYYNDRPENMAWCLKDAGAKFLLLDDGTIWPALREHATALERVVCLNNPVTGDDKVRALDAWLPATGQAPVSGPATQKDLATIVYTSGTTGRPKGVMLTHGNLVIDVARMSKACPEIVDTDIFLSFLPLSHTLERTVGYYIPIYVGAQTRFARGITELAEDMVTQRPTILVCVPRIFERVYNKIQEGLPPGSPKRALFDKTVDVGWKRFRGEASLTDQLLWPVLNLLVARKVRARLGGRLRYVLLGGAPMPAHLFRIFFGLGITFLHGYGLTETSPALCFNRATDNEPFSVGRPLEGIEVKTADNGELLVRGAIVMRGYWNNPEATGQAIDAEGWFHTGDVVTLTDGRIYITDRLKDIIVLTNGENVSPTDTEQAILSDPVFEQVMVIGEARPRLGLLAVSKLEDTKELCDRANKQLHGFPGYARICYVTRLEEPWTVENGLLTPTLKLKRNVIEQRFADKIDAMYGGKELC